MTIRLCAVAAWRQALHFTDAERAALALAEAVTRLSDRVDPVPDAIWELALTGPGAITYGRRWLQSLKLSTSTTMVTVIARATFAGST
jgi:hypothetical protein